MRAFARTLPLASFVRLPCRPVLGAAVLGLEALGVATSTSMSLLRESLGERRATVEAVPPGTPGT